MRPAVLGSSTAPTDSLAWRFSVAIDGLRRSPSRSQHELAAVERLRVAGRGLDAAQPRDRPDRVGAPPGPAVLRREVRLQQVDLALERAPRRCRRTGSGVRGRRRTWGSRTPRRGGGGRSARRSRPRAGDPGGRRRRAGRQDEVDGSRLDRLEQVLHGRRGSREPAVRQVADDHLERSRRRRRTRRRWHAPRPPDPASPMPRPTGSSCRGARRAGAGSWRRRRSRCRRHGQPTRQDGERPGAAERQAPHRGHAGSAGCQTAHGGRPVSNAPWSAWTSLSVSIGAQKPSYGSPWSLPAAMSRANGSSTSSSPGPM